MRHFAAQHGPSFPMLAVIEENVRASVSVGSILTCDSRGEQLKITRALVELLFLRTMQ